MAVSRPSPVTTVQRLYALQALQTASTDLRPSVASRSFLSKLLSQLSLVVPLQSRVLMAQTLFALLELEIALTDQNSTVELQSPSQSSLAASRPLHATMVQRLYVPQELLIVSTGPKLSVASKSSQSKSLSQLKNSQL